MKPVLNIDHVSKIYPNRFKALEDVSFQVEQGDFLGLLGRNGAGKTTLISCIANLSQLSHGKIEVLGYDVNKHPNITKKLVGIVPQELVFDPFFTVKETLTFQSGYFGVRNNKTWIEEILLRLNLMDKVNQNTRSLSGGMKRRLMVAQALVHKPPIIILDEPTAGVDVELRQSLWQFIQELNQQGHTIILTTHYLEEAEQFCNRIAILKQGKLVAFDTTRNLLNYDDKIYLSFDSNNDSNNPTKDLFNGFLLQNNHGHWKFELNNYKELETLLAIINSQQLKIENMKFLDKNLAQVFTNLMK